MARRERTSTICALESCTRSVRYDNPTFPFCKDHVGLKSMRSRMSAYAARDMNSTREMLYNPQRTAMSEAASVASVISSASHLPYATTGKAYVSWRKTLRGASPDNPDDMLSRRDDLLNAVGNSLTSSGLKVDPIHCESGRVMMPDGSWEQCGDHEILMASRDGDEVLVDPAASAPLSGVTSSVSKTFGSGESTCGDGLYIAPLFEYASFSAVSYRRISSDDTMLWENLPVTENSEVQSQRDLVSGRTLVFPEVIYRDSPELDPVEDVEDVDPLDAIFDDEPTIEDLRRERRKRVSGR